MERAVRWSNRLAASAINCADDLCAHDSRTFLTHGRKVLLRPRVTLSAPDAYVVAALLNVDVFTRVLSEDFDSAIFLIAIPRSYPQQQPASLEMFLDAHRVAIADQLRKPGTEEAGCAAAEGCGRGERCKASSGSGNRAH